MALNEDDAKALQTKAEEKQEETKSSHENLDEGMAASKVQELEKISLLSQKPLEILDENELDEGAFIEGLYLDDITIEKKQEKHEKFIDAFMSKNNPFWKDSFICPISRYPMWDPVIVSNGQSYDRESAVELLKAAEPKCAITREPLNRNVMIPNTILKSMISQAIQDFKKSEQNIEYKDFNFDPTVRMCYENDSALMSHEEIVSDVPVDSDHKDCVCLCCGILSLPVCIETTHAIFPVLHCPTAQAACVTALSAGIAASAITTSLGSLLCLGGIFSIRSISRCNSATPAEEQDPMAISGDEDLLINESEEALMNEGEQAPINQDESASNQSDIPLSNMMSLNSLRHR